MGELFLSGGGNAEQTREVNEYFIQKIDPVKPLLYIPLAGDPKFRTYDRCLDYVKSMFNPLGVSEIMMWTDLREKTIDDVTPFSAVYISGGDPTPIIAIPEGTAVYATPHKLSVLGLDEAYLFDKENKAVMEKV
ncbi:hypothetical protein ACTWQL_05820 [Pseudalkalibacillus sp. R45]|uniref:hypothetical protein n=1 Tax=Pseudalkalibacillus sp. R45 TaxID=3457433 RepID=UPI003FCDBC51